MAAGGEQFDEDGAGVDGRLADAIVGGIDGDGAGDKDQQKEDETPYAGEVVSQFFAQYGQHLFKSALVEILHIDIVQGEFLDFNLN